MEHKRKVGRPKKHTEPYSGNEEKLQKSFDEYLECVKDCFGEPYDDREGKRCDRLRNVCREFDISIPKARKLLITAGVYTTALSRQVAEYADMGKTEQQIMQLTGLSRSSVSSYLPYKKYPYNMEEVSRHTQDSRMYRLRKRAVERLLRCIECGAGADEQLWDTLIDFQRYSFYTASGLAFQYKIRQNKRGKYTGEMEITRKEESKTLTRSTVLLAFHAIIGAKEGTAPQQPQNNSEDEPFPREYKGPKAIGPYFGISYLYGIFWRFGLIRVPEKVAKRMHGGGQNMVRNDQ